ncbi:RHS domain-containing protein [Acinetobacter baumannii]|nr:RHS domain-containing protein [Acinetobacter baumannii]
MNGQDLISTAEYRYDALGRRIQKRSKHHHTGDEHNIIYGWDGNTLAYESNEQITKHYIYEKDSFVPLAQAVYAEEIELHQTPDWADKPYSLQRDPLWKVTKTAKDFKDFWFYHCDHLGTPQEMTDHTGAVIWKAEYKVWGECKAEIAKSNFFENSEIISNNIRFQGQYFDEETGLHYNRYRYYSPYVGRFISKDPIGLSGGDNLYAYAVNTTGWVDPLGLSSSCPLNCPAGTLDPSTVHFMQSSAKNQTGDYTVLGNAESLKSGTLDANVLRAKVWKDSSGKIWTLDHRRLAAFKLAKKCMPITWASAQEVDQQMWKMSTKNGGTSMRLKLGNGQSTVVK